MWAHNQWSTCCYHHQHDTRGGAGKWGREKGGRTGIRGEHETCYSSSRNKKWGLKIMQCDSTKSEINISALKCSVRFLKFQETILNWNAKSMKSQMHFNSNSELSNSKFPNSKFPNSKLPNSKFENSKCENSKFSNFPKPRFSNSQFWAEFHNVLGLIFQHMWTACMACDLHQCTQQPHGLHMQHDTMYSTRYLMQSPQSISALGTLQSRMLRRPCWKTPTAESHPIGTTPHAK